MRLLATAISIGLLVGVAPNAYSQEFAISPDLRAHIEFRSLGSQRIDSFTWEEGIKRKAFSIVEHVIEPNETYSSIIERYGIRSDPVSIKFHRKLNEDRFIVRGLQPGTVFVAIKPNQEDQMAISMYPQIKSQTEQTEQSLRSRQPAIRAWSEGHPGNSTVMHARELYEGIVNDVQQFRVTGYALDRSELELTNQALREIESIMDSVLAGNRRLEEKELTFFEQVGSWLNLQVASAGDTDSSTIETRIRTKVRDSMKERSGLSVCFKNAMHLYLHKRQFPKRKPQWSCDEDFHTLSSPAKSRFRRSLQYVIWAVDSDQRVSEHKVIEIEPNQSDGTFEGDLAVKAS